MIYFVTVNIFLFAFSPLEKWIIKIVWHVFQVDTVYRGVQFQSDLP